MEMRVTEGFGHVGSLTAAAVYRSEAISGSPPPSSSARLSSPPRTPPTKNKRAPDFTPDEKERKNRPPPEPFPTPEFLRMMIFLMRQMEDRALLERRIRAAQAEAEEYRRNHPQDEEEGNHPQEEEEGNRPQDEEEDSDAETLVLDQA